MRRSLIYLVQLAVFVAVAVWLVQNPGGVRVDWLGWRLETPFALFLLVIGIALWIAAVGWRAALATVRAPFSFWRHRSAHRHEEGYKALVQGMAAVAVGDEEEGEAAAVWQRRVVVSGHVLALLREEGGGELELRHRGPRFGSRAARNKRRARERRAASWCCIFLRAGGI